MDDSRRRAKPSDNLVNNILPSYHMFQSTISKNLTPTDENFRVDPPVYEVTPVTSSATSAAQSPMDSRQEHFPSVSTVPASTSSVNLYTNATTNLDISTFNEELADIWENTILANVHKLANLSDTDNHFSQDLEIVIKVTENVCQKGEAPTIIDPSQYEYKQGDYIHGYVTITNKLAQPIPFDMVYVVFEGQLIVLDNNHGLLDNHQPQQVYKFLNMLDLFASWSYANIDRLATDNGDPHDWCEGETDPTDNTCLLIDVKRFFQPNITYKRFFSFRIPDKLLDDACEKHALVRHTEIPPSVGVARNLKSIPLMYLSNTSKNTNKLKDFCFIDTFVSYSVDARVIGKALEYNHRVKTPLRHRDQYVVAKEAMCPIRVVPLSYHDYNPESDRSEQVSLYYKAFLDSITAKLDEGESILENPLLPVNSPSPLQPTRSTTRLKQLYTLAHTTTTESLRRQFKQLNAGADTDDTMYQYLAPFKKKLLTGSAKTLGVVSLLTPKVEYKSLYVPPLRFRNSDPKHDTTITVPVEVAYFHENGAKATLPEIKAMSLELVVLTVRSRKYEIPFEFNHDMCFKDKVVHSEPEGLMFSSLHPVEDTNDFDHVVLQPFQKHYNHMTQLIKRFGDDPLFRVETSLFNDLKAVAHLQTKYIYLSINNPQFLTSSTSTRGHYTSIGNIPWEPSLNQNYNIYTKKFSLELDLSKCHPKGTEPFKDSCFNHFTLVPLFQTCFMARLYYVKVSLKLTNGTVLLVNVPITIEN